MRSRLRARLRALEPRDHGDGPALVELPRTSDVAKSTRETTRSRRRGRARAPPSARFIQARISVKID